MQSKKRDGLISAILSILTCGLYNIYFWYRYGEDVNVICEEDGKTTLNYIVAWLLSGITCGIYGMYWTYTLASRLDTASKKYDVNVESPVFFTLFMKIPFLSFFYACDIMNKFQEKYDEMYPNGNGNFGYGGNVPPTQPFSSQNIQNMGSQIGSQLKSAVQEVGNGIRNTAQDVMPTCKNCGAIVPPGKNYCKNCGYPVNGPVVQNNQPSPAEEAIPPMQDETVILKPETESVKICPICGSAVKPGDKFCIHCGSKVE